MRADGPGSARWLRRFAALFAGVPAALAVTCARAELVDIVWTADGRFERSLPVAAGRFVEVCGALHAGQAVPWSFESDAALDFNIFNALRLRRAALVGD